MRGELYKISPGFPTKAHIRLDKGQCSVQSLSLQQLLKDLLLKSNQQ